MNSGMLESHSNTPQHSSASPAQGELFNVLERRRLKVESDGTQFTNQTALELLKKADVVKSLSAAPSEGLSTSVLAIVRPLLVTAYESWETDVLSLAELTGMGEHNRSTLEYGRAGRGINKYPQSELLKTFFF